MAKISGVSRQVEKDLFHGNCRPRTERLRTKYYRKDKHKSRRDY